MSIKDQLRADILSGGAEERAKVRSQLFRCECHNTAMECSLH